MKKFVIPVLIVAVVVVMYIFYQQPFGGGSPVNASMAKEQPKASSQSGEVHSSKNLEKSFNEALKNADTEQPQSMQQQSNEGIIPEKLIIPKIKVEASVEKVGLLKNGAVGVPSGTEHVAWYKKGAKPGQNGNAVIDGHVDSYKGPAVFFHLEDLKKNDKVYVVGKDGKKLTFKVVKIESYPTGNAPIEKVFGYTNQPMLNLITCTGTYQESKGTHDHRLVVYTQLVEK